MIRFDIYIYIYKGTEKTFWFIHLYNNCTTKKNNHCSSGIKGEDGT
jgi:hypothetical protein